MVPFESLGAVSYSSSIITMTLSCVVCEIFSVKACDLEIGAKGHSRSLEMVPFDRLYTTFYLSAIVTVPFSSYLTLNNIVTLKSGLEVRSLKPAREGEESEMVDYCPVSKIPLRGRRGYDTKLMYYRIQFTPSRNEQLYRISSIIITEAN